MTLRATVVGFALGVVTTLGVLATRDAMGQRSVQTSAGFGRDAFGEALDAILDRYVEPIDSSTLLARGLKQIVATLDPHSHYLTAAERKALEGRARGGSTGLTVVLRVDGSDRWLEVVGVAPGSAAESEGLKAGDRVLAVGAVEVASMLSQIEAEAALLGAVGETIELTVRPRRAATKKLVRLELGKVAKKALVRGDLVASDKGKVATIRIHAFGPDTGLRTQKLYDKLRLRAGAAGLAGVVLDLRGNPGGEVDEALVVADLFVESGILTRTRGRGGKILREEKAHAAGTDTTTPLVVLQDQHTASAAELLAAALRDNGRARVVGELSYGKGTVQEVRGMPDGSVLTLTIARYFSPKDELIDGVGVRPDDLVVLRGKTEAEVLATALGSIGLTPT